MSQQLLKTWLESYLPVPLQEAKDYFAKKKYRGMYYVELKRQLAQEAKRFNPGLTLHRLGEVFNCDHSTAHKLLHPVKEMLPEVINRVRLEGKDWIKEGLYPISRQTKRDGRQYNYLELRKL